ncbi:MAG: DUF2442 domain-containing protein [Planctomycetota bacterium]
MAGEEKFVAFDAFPWFLDSPIGQLLDVRVPSPGHLYWPQLDVDIAVESIDHPERFPLMTKRRRNGAGGRPKGTRRASIARR